MPSWDPSGWDDRYPGSLRPALARFAGAVRSLILRVRGAFEVR
jgi:hypothetical protein